MTTEPPAQHDFPAPDTAPAPLAPAPFTRPPPPRVPGLPRLWTAWVGLLIAFVCSLIASVVGVVLFLAVSGAFTDFSKTDPDRAMELLMTPMGVVFAIVPAQLVFAGVAILAARLSPEGLRRRLGLVAGSLPWYGYPLAALGTMFLPLVVDTIIWQLLFEEASDHIVQMARALSSGTGASAVLIVLSASVLPGVCEELLFRGYLQTRLHQRWRPWIVLIITGVVFGVFHLDLQHALGAGVLGVWLSWLRFATGSVYPAIICHFFNNFVALVSLQFMDGTDSLTDSGLATGDVLTWAAAGISTVAFIAVIAVINASRRRAQTPPATV